MNEYQLGVVAGLVLSAEPVAIVGTIVLWTVLSGIGVGLLDLPLAQAIAGGLVAVFLHWASEIVHNLGHAWAAQRTGHPMVGIRLGQWLTLATSVYPPDEGPLPGKIHIQRALGGPLGSLALSVVAGIMALALCSSGGVARWVSLFFFVDNFFLLTLGAFLPLGFTDGSTLLAWWGKR
jgi:hypothetical protein